VAAPDLVAVGHVTLDRFGEATRPGGAALYAAVAAQRLGLSVGLLTSHGDDFPLDLVPPQIEVIAVPAKATTTFEHRAGPEGRVLRVAAAATGLAAAHLPEDWADARIAILAPVLQEVDPLVAAAFTDAAVAVAAQGYLRGLGQDGRVTPAAWPSPGWLLQRIQALFLSREDVDAEAGSVAEWFQRVPVGALTAGREGAQVYVNGQGYEVRPRPAHEVDETGAGDVFAAVFMVHYEADGDPWRAAAAATCAGSLTVEGEGWSTVPDRARLAAALAAYEREE
jgi:sugar/nucleoside kinase (ribokinase family)